MDASLLSGVYGDVHADRVSGPIGQWTHKKRRDAISRLDPTAIAFETGDLLDPISSWPMDKPGMVFRRFDRPYHC